MADDTQLNQDSFEENSFNEEPAYQDKQKGTKKISKKLKIAGVVVLALFMLGGGAAALYIQSVKNRPENVAAKAIGEYVFGLKNAGKSKMALKVSSSENQAINFDLGLEVATTDEIKAAQINFDANVGPFRLRGGVQTAENGNIYIKLKDLPTLLGPTLGAQGGVTGEMTAQIESLGETWIEITKEDLESFGGEAISQSDECTTAVGEALMGDELGELFDDLYTKHMFLTSKNSSTEEVEGRKLLKVEVGLNKEKATKFGNDVKESAIFKALAEKCQEEFKTYAGEESTGGQLSDTLQNGKLTIWADRSKKELIKLEASADMVTDGTKTGAMSLTVEPNKGDVTIEKIEDGDKVNIKDLLTMFGLSPEMLQGLAQPAAL